MSNAPISNDDLMRQFENEMHELFLLPAEIWQNIAKNILDKLDMMRKRVQEKIDRFENDSAYREEWRKWLGQPSIPQVTLPPRPTTELVEEGWEYVNIFFSDTDKGRLYRDTAVLLDTIPLPAYGYLTPIGILLDIAAFAGSATDIYYSDASRGRKFGAEIVAFIGLSGIPLNTGSFFIDIKTNSLAPIIISDVKISDFTTKDGWNKIAHTNPYINLGFYHAVTKGTDKGSKYPPDINYVDYIVERIPSKQKIESYLWYMLIDKTPKSEKRAKK